MKLNDKYLIRKFVEDGQFVLAQVAFLVPSNCSCHVARVETEEALSEMLNFRLGYFYEGASDDEEVCSWEQYDGDQVLIDTVRFAQRHGLCVFINGYEVEIRKEALDQDILHKIYDDSKED